MGFEDYAQPHKKDILKPGESLRRRKDGGFDVHSSEEEIDLSRRKLLTSAVGLGVAAMIPKEQKVLKKIFEESPYDFQDEDLAVSTNEPFVPKKIGSDENAVARADVLARERIERNDLDTIGETIGAQVERDGRVALNPETKKAVYEHWKTQYGEGGNLHDDLLEAMESLQPWIADIKDIFHEESVPEEFSYLIIPESHARARAISPAGAAGPMQFMPTNVTRHYGLEFNDDYDERLDFLLSARAAVKHLRDSYERFGRNWTFALMDYNGGFTNDFLKHLDVEEHSTPITEQTRYAVLPGEGLFAIAEKFNTSLTLLKRANGFVTKEDELSIQPKQELTIPQKRDITYPNFLSWLEKRINDDLRNDTAANTLAKYKENINYPEKFYAVLDLIKELQLMEKFPPERTYGELNVKEKVTDFAADVSRDGRIQDIAQSLQKSLAVYTKDPPSLPTLIQMLHLKNSHAVEHIDGESIVRRGHKLTLTITAMREKRPSLKDVAQERGYTVEELTEINPSIKNTEKQLPHDILRIPLRATGDALAQTNS